MRPPADPDPSAPIRIGPATAVAPKAHSTGVVYLQPGFPSPRAELDDALWPRVQGYELLTVIGTGGMGIVYMARQCDLQRTVAVKMLRGLGQTDAEYHERLRVEAETVAKLQHPNIIQVFEIGAAEPQAGEPHPSPFIAFEYVDGGSLAQRTAAPQPPADAAALVEKVARAVHAAHRLGVVHRDLKPANVLLTRDGEPKVADFGLAKHYGDAVRPADRFLTRAGVVMGTPGYMAPEQAAGEAISPSVDVYSLGVILYELLTGRIPFQGANPVETMLLVRTQDPVSPRQLQPKVARDLETICLKCLAKEPHRRYATAEALAGDLARWREGRPIVARPVGVAGHLARSARRNPTAAALAVAVVGVAVAGVCGVVWQWREAVANAAAAGNAATRAEEAAAAARESTRAERWERYRSHLAAAANALELNNVVAARQALETAPEEHRGWEWHHFYNRLDTSVCALRWPGRRLGNVWFTPDGRRVLVDADNGAARVWDVAERREVRTYPKGFDRGRISPDGNTILAFGPDHTVVLRDIATDRERVFRGHTAHVPFARLNGDGTRLVTASLDGSIRTWDAATGTQVSAASVPPKDLSGLAVGPSFDYALVSYRGSHGLKACDITSGKVSPLYEGDHLSRGVEFDVTGKRFLALETFPRNTLHLWDANPFRPVATMRGHTNELTRVAFSPDGSRIASGSMDQTARLWDAATGSAVAALRDHKGWVNDVAFNPDGRRLLTASLDQTLRLWDGADGKPLTVLCGHTGEVVAAAFVGDGTFLASASRDGTVRVWDAAAAERNGALRGHTKYVYGAAFGPDGRRVASASWDGTVRVWDAGTGRQVWERSHGENWIAVSVAFHPQGHLVASLGREGTSNPTRATVRLWDADTGREVHTWDVPTDWRDSRLAFSPNGAVLAAGVEGGEVRMWDVAGRREVGNLYHGGHATRDVAYSPDGKLLAVASEDPGVGVRLWSVESKAPVASLKSHVSSVYAVAFSPNGSRLASGSVDGTVRLWDVTTGAELAAYKHGSNVYAVAFTRDGSRVVSACADGVIRVWDVATGAALAELRGHRAYVHSLAFSPDGTRLVSGSGDATLRVWEATSPPGPAMSH